MDLLKSEHNQALPLRFVETFLFTTLWQNGLFRLFLALVFISLQALNVAGLYFGIVGRTVHRYLPLVLGTQPGAFGIITALLLFKRNVQNLKTGTIYQFTDSRVILKMRWQYQSMIVSFVLAAALSVVTHLILVIPFHEDEPSFNHMVMVIEKYSGPYYALCMGLLYGSIITIGFCVICPICLASYIITLGKLKIYIIKDKLSQILNQCHVEEKLLYDEEYQNSVSEKLKLCVEEHVKFIQFARKCMENCRIGIIITPIGSIAAVGSGYFIVKNISPKNNFKPILGLVTDTLALIYMCIVGQDCEDMTGSITDNIMDMPWFYWNKRNMKTLLIFLMNAKTVELRGYGTISMNYGLLITFCKWMYSLTTVLY